jgi:hypothetical protein
MVYGHLLQADHCRQPPAWKGIWKDPKGRSHYVEACGEHAPKASAAFQAYAERVMAESA